ncbi:MAG: glutamyl-tRNA reductase [Planctomycetaceae bacterium]
MKSLLVLGLSHKSAPLEAREPLARLDQAAAVRQALGFAQEAAVLSTCNRFELYLAGSADAGAAEAWLAAAAGVSPEALRPHLVVRQGRNAAKHLFFVASSLDSLIVGETQIRAQVKEAYQRTCAAGGAGRALHRLFQAALRVSKEIASATGVGRGSVSVAGAAADLAAQVFGDLSGARLLLVGAGETAELVLAHLASRGVGSCVIANRTLETALALAQRVGGEAIPLESVAARLGEADLVVAASAGEAPLLGVSEFRAALRQRRGRPMVAIDISMPRALDPAVDVLDNIYRYDMEALTAVTTDALRHRRKDFLQCCTLVDGAALRLEAEIRAEEAGETIAELEKEYVAVGDGELSELERRLPSLGEEERAEVRRSFNRLVRKLLHMPVKALREGDEIEVRAVRRVFRAPRGRDE